jgi:hypothetical protein
MMRNPDSAIQRLQVGLVGLLIVLIFVSLANMLSAGADSGVKSTASGATANGGDGGKAVTEEPLGELGVTPVVTEQPDKQPSKAPPPLPAPAPQP